MAESNGTFVFEIIVDKFESLVNSPHMVLMTIFPNVFCLELRHPNKMPSCGLTGTKKAAISKPMSRTCEKWKRSIYMPASEQAKQSRQTVMFSCSADFLIRNMKMCPLALSLWNENDNLIYVGSATLPWNPIFLDVLQRICNCEVPSPVYLKEGTNIFQDRTGKMVANVELQLKLTYLTNKRPPALITCPGNPKMRNDLSDMNSKMTHICGFAYTDNKNVSGTNTYLNNSDSCKQIVWPTDELAERFVIEASNRLYPLAVHCGNESNDSCDATLDIADIRGPCGRKDCNIARDIRNYIENLVGADKIKFDFNNLMSTRGHRVCTLPGKTQNFERHEDYISRREKVKEIPAQGSFLQKMLKEVTKKQSSTSIRNKSSDETGRDASRRESQMYCYNVPIPKVYVVYYFTVEYNFDKKPNKDDSPNPTSNESSKAPTSKESSRAPSSKDPTSKASSNAPSSKDSSESVDSDRFEKFTYCPSTCPVLKLAESAVCSKAICGIHNKDSAKDDSSDSKCTSPVCTSKLEFPPSPADSDVVIKFKEIYNPCCVKSCDISERVKEFIAGSAARSETRRKCREMEDAQDPCYCDCVCTFKFSSKTTYCGICGGYECIGDDTRDLPPYARPHPCPVYHKLYDKKYIVVKSPWPEEEKKENSSAKLPSKSSTSRAAEKTVAAVKAPKAGAPEKEVKVTKETAQETKKKSKEGKKKVGKFTANATAAPAQTPVEKKKSDANKYAYPSVPSHMGWNWLAKDIPGMEPRPKWRPGAANKILVRRYRSLMEGSDTIAKKKRAMLQRKKKIEMKPTLIVSKRDGEFTVQMEVFKKYSKERLLYQYPYDEKPPLIYTIGKTAAEQNKLQRQRDRRARRDSRRKSRLLQSTFRDKCQEICLKAYNQAIGLQPLPNPNNPECPCATEAEPSISPAIDSCSCSDEVTISSSDTDHDEWVIEFTPPMANWDAKAKHPPLMEEDDTQYNYLDYKVKLFDRNGNPVPRFFKTHEGKTECSDLGGFWGPGHIWLEINKDGFIGPDERWVPMNFFGPDGMSYSAEDGYFMDNTGQTLKLGVDGYVDKDLKWVWYPGRKKQTRNSIVSNDEAAKASPDHTKGKSTGTAPATNAAPPQNNVGDKGTGDKGAGEKGTKGDKGAGEKGTKGDKGVGEKGTKGDKGTSEKGTKGDKGAGEKGTKVKTVDKRVVVEPGPKQGTSNKKHSSDKNHNPVVMNVSVIRDRKRVQRTQKDRMPYVDFKKLSKYREIMGGFETNDDFSNVKPLSKTNRASNTPRKKLLHPSSQRMHKHTESVTYATTSFARTVNKTTSTISSSGTWCK